MNKHRKFNAQKFFDAFMGHEDELAYVFEAEEVDLPDPFSVEAARQTVIDAKPGTVDKLVATLYELNDLATSTGREMVELAALAFELQGMPGDDVPNPRVAIWIFRKKHKAFEHALQLLAVRSVRGGQIALFPGRKAINIDDPAAAVAKLRIKLDQMLPEMAKTERFEVRHYMDGEVLVIPVFCERTAEVQLEFEGSGHAVTSKIRRPVSQDIIFYNQHNGELEIEAGRPKHREILRAAFAESVFDDISFFPTEETSRVLDLGQLSDSDFSLQVSSGHSARITGLKVSGLHHRNRFVIQCAGGSVDTIDVLRSRGNLDSLKKMDVQFVRIELILAPGRRGRKVIELSGDNRIKFNRESYSNEVYAYLRTWRLMRSLARDSAA